MLTKIGAITIGQSPRDDIIPDLKKLMGVKIPIEVLGVLDNFEKEEIKKLSPNRKEEVLMTRRWRNMRKTGSSLTASRQLTSNSEIP